MMAVLAAFSQYNSLCGQKFFHFKPILTKKNDAEGAFPGLSKEAGADYIRGVVRSASSHPLRIDQ